MSNFVYVCFGWPNSDLIKVGRTSNPKIRCFSHFPISIVSDVYELASEADMIKAEMIFHKSWQPLAVRQNGGLCETYHLSTKEAAEFLEMVLLEEFGEVKRRSDLQGETFGSIHQKVEGFVKTDAGFNSYRCSCGGWVRPSKIQNHLDGGCTPSKEYVELLQKRHRDAPDADL